MGIRDGWALYQEPSADALILTTNRLFGFFFGSTLAGGAVYYYALQEYKASNEMLTEDIYVRGPHNTSKWRREKEGNADIGATKL